MVIGRNDSVTYHVLNIMHIKTSYFLFIHSIKDMNHKHNYGKNMYLWQ